MASGTAQSVVDVLRKVQFLNAVSEEFLGRLALIAQAVTFPAGSLVFRQGDMSNSFYLLLDGNVALEIGASAVGSKRILTVGTGELLGWSPVLGQPRMSATARALTDVLAIELEAAACLAICESEPRFGYELMKRTAIAIAKRLEATRLQLLDVYGSNMPLVSDERPVS